MFLAGDAAHVHSPLAVAAAVQGCAPPALLDTYEAERHAVGRQVRVLTDTFDRLVLGRSAVVRAATRPTYSAGRPARRVAVAEVSAAVARWCEPAQTLVPGHPR